MSANGHGIIALTVRAHCQRQVAFFSILLLIFSEIEYESVHPPDTWRSHLSAGCG